MAASVAYLGAYLTKCARDVVQNLFGDRILREVLRYSLGKWLRKLYCYGDAIKQHEYKRKFITKLQNAPVAIETDTANEQHYEVPTEYFKTVLGKRLKYSACYWPDGVTNIDQAEEAMLELYCEKARVEDGQNIMDLGCGWGTLGLWICEKYPNCTVTCVSNSNTQGDHILSEAEKHGYSDRLKFLKCDANNLDTDQRFDRIMSIEMFEHMKNYEKLFARVASWLKPDGLLFTQILCHREFSYNFSVKQGADTEWMARNFFSGGTMPSTDLFLYFQNDVVLVDLWKVNGKHYSKTLEAWLNKLDLNKREVTRIFDAKYGEEETPQQIANWRKFFIYCSEVFGFKGGNEWMVSFHLFKKR
ncbi:uncharacterized protein [Ptychodera flava]|uniref:uncharacterized protein n=1 Tax=Ptychodera flava TaxID=63121 RepID=UPI00396AA746